MRAPKPATRDQTVQSVDRALSILQSLSDRGPSGVTEIAADVGIHKATTHRLLATLEARGMVSQDSDRGQYRLGPAASRLAARASGGDEVVVSCRPLCLELATQVGDTVNLVVSDGLQIITVDQAVGDAIVVSQDFVGKRDPLHATAAGKVFLAALPDDELDERLRGELTRYTPQTVTDPVALRAQLEAVREQGWATTTEEHELGLVVLAAPVREPDGEVVAAMTVSGPTYRVNDGTLPELTARLLEMTDRAGWRLGALKRQ
ncbi:IclR family transcriptional regulator [Pseudokineococcus sp. 1T1Z-3]|uniref:IclR family transcriptional regulator n=1 Tax=Pseudokineococcus sp. 1T1Z-3 TaxID=3132745 RepID=UPI0030AD2C36